MHSTRSHRPTAVKSRFKTECGTPRCVFIATCGRGDKKASQLPGIRSTYNSRWPPWSSGRGAVRWKNRQRTPRYDARDEMVKFTVGSQKVDTDTYHTTYLVLLHNAVAIYTIRTTLRLYGYSTDDEGWSRLIASSQATERELETENTQSISTNCGNAEPYVQPNEGTHL